MSLGLVEPAPLGGDPALLQPGRQENVPIARTFSMPNEVVRALEARQILRSEQQAGLSWFVLLSDALVAPIQRGLRQAEPSADGGEAAPTIDGYVRMAEAALRSGLLDLAHRYAETAVGVVDQDASALAEAHLFLGRVVGLRARGADKAVAGPLYETTAKDLPPRRSAVRRVGSC
jgi:hypothetical protein